MNEELDAKIKKITEETEILIIKNRINFLSKTAITTHIFYHIFVMSLLLLLSIGAMVFLDEADGGFSLSTSIISFLSVVFFDMVLFQKLKEFVVVSKLKKDHAIVGFFNTTLSFVYFSVGLLLMLFYISIGNSYGASFMAVFGIYNYIMNLEYDKIGVKVISWKI